MEKIEAEAIVRSRRRTVALVITQRATLVVRAPMYTPASFIEEFIARKSSWIRKKIAEAAGRSAQGARQFVEGERFSYLGSHYPLAVVDEAAIPFSFAGRFQISRSALPDARALFADWYRQEASAMIRARCDLYASLTGLEYRRCTITDGRSRWGSCTAKDNLSFNWRLIMAPLDIIDYVVVHELAHIEHKDHSKKFWGRVESIFPEYGESRRWLKDHGHLMTI